MSVLIPSENQTEPEGIVRKYEWYQGVIIVNYCSLESTLKESD